MYTKYNYNCFLILWHNERAQIEAPDPVATRASTKAAFQTEGLGYASVR